MKRKEICERTGLTPKALRLYEEKGLISPQSESAGHNRQKEYSMADLQRLMTISMLRRALFTMAEIKEMLDSPETIQTIFPQYLEWIRLQKAQLDQLVAVSSAIDISTVHSAEELTSRLRTAAARLPIPASDIHFNFKKLDAIEEPRPSFTASQRLDAQLPDREFRQTIVMGSKAGWDNLLAGIDFINDTRDTFHPEGIRTSDETVIKQTFLQRLLRAALVIIAILAFVKWFLHNTVYPMQTYLLIAAIAATALRVLLAVLDHRKKTKQWVKNIGWEQASFDIDKRKVLLIVCAVLLGIGLLALGIYAIVEYSTPVESTDGPSTEGVDLEEFWDNLDPQLLRNLDFYIPHDADLGKVPAITASPNKIYFLWGGFLFSIDADYTDISTIDTNVYGGKGSHSIVRDPIETPCTMFCYDGCIYYFARDSRAGRSYLMRHQTGTKIKPEKIVCADSFNNTGFTAIGLSEDGEIIAYSRPQSRWQEVGRIPLPE